MAAKAGTDDVTMPIAQDQGDEEEQAVAITETEEIMEKSVEEESVERFVGKGTESSEDGYKDDTGEAQSSTEPKSLTEKKGPYILKTAFDGYRAGFDGAMQNHEAEAKRTKEELEENIKEMKNLMENDEEEREKMEKETKRIKEDFADTMKKMETNATEKVEEVKKRMEE